MKTTKDKKIVSQFEFAIMEVAAPEEAKEYRPRTDEEELHIRKENLLNVGKQLRCEPI